MTARCASCSYPLTISDSIECYECTSYFHIDCAQLVGFPFFELSSDPNRNRFLCATCELLPLPQHRSDSDSDTDIEGASDLTMPSRQLDYHLDTQGDFAKDMNEIKGSVQDLSELCKDMLREINDLKSINLTLRCCVENLRHENEERGSAITDLRLRIEALELSGRTEKTKNVKSNDSDAPGTAFDKEVSLERYLTPEREELEIERPEGVDASRKKREINDSEYVSGVSNLTSFRTEETEKNAQNFTSAFKTSLEDETQNEWGKKEKNSELEYSEHEKIPEKEEGRENEESEENITFSSSEEKKEEVACETEENRQDWSWKGNKAVELEEPENENDNADDEEENEESETENEDAQSWQILDEEIHHNTLSNQTSEDIQESTNDDIWNENKDGEKDFEEEVLEQDRKEQLFSKVIERSGTNNEDGDWRISKNEVTYYDEDDIETLEGEEDDYGTIATKGEEKETDREEDGDKTLEKEGEEKEAPSGEEGEKPLEGTEKGEAVEGAELLEGESRPEGGLCLEGEPRLEGEPSLEGEPPREGQQDGELGPEGQPRLEGALPAEGEVGAQEGQLGGGQSPEDGEVQPPGTPVPEIPQHSEEDLWEYLKESVTSEHPATVEEFVQKLVGTLQHVPQEYLLPVIDANIKRAISPSVTDGEHLPPQEGVILTEEGILHGGESAEPEATGGDTVQAPEGDPPSGESKVPTEGEALVPEAREDTEAEGYPVVEAAA